MCYPFGTSIEFKTNYIMCFIGQGNHMVEFNSETQETVPKFYPNKSLLFLNIWSMLCICEFSVYEQSKGPINYMQITKSENCELNVLLWKKTGKLCIIIVLYGLILEEKNVDDGFSGLPFL